MKKIILGLIATMLFTIMSYSQNSIKITSTVTEEEYKSAELDIQRMSDLVNTAIGALSGYSLNGKTEYKEVVVSYSLNKDAKDSNFIAFTPYEQLVNSISKNSCTATGLSSAIGCYKKIKAYMEANHLDDLDIHVHWNSNGSVTVTW